MSTLKTPQSEIDSIIALFSDNKLQEALDKVKALSKSFPEDSLLHNITGACYAGLDQLSSAIKCYEKAIEIKPDYAKAHYNLAGTYHELEKMDDSIKSYQRSLKIDSNYAEAHNNLGNVFRDLGRLDEAFESFEKAVAINPEYIEAHYSLALIFEEYGELEQMIFHLESVIKIQPDLSKAHNRIGDALQQLGHFNKAIEYYKKAIIYDSNFSEAYNNLGNIFKNTGQLEDAVTYYKKALEINPDYPALHNNLGSAYRDLKQLDNAEKSYKKALECNPDFPDSLNNLGIILFEQGQIDKAVKSFKKAIAIRSDYDEAYNNLGRVFLSLGELNEAVANYEKALNINPDNLKTYDNLAAAYLQFGHTDDAIRYYKKSIEINPNFAYVHNNLGNVFKQLNLLDEAFKCYEKAIELSPGFAEGYNNLGTTFKDLNQFENAKKSFERAIELSPDFAIAYNNLGNLYKDFDCLDEALNNYERAFDIENSLDNVLGNILSTKINSCNWNGLAELLVDAKKRIVNNERVVEPFTLLGLIDDSAIQRKATELRVNANHPKNHTLPTINPYPKHSKIRIGYFSADFREHPLAYLTAELYELHDREHFEIHAFSFGPDTQDAVNLRIKAGVDHFHNVQSMLHLEMALFVRSLEIDIAIDLGGFTHDARTDVFAMSAAPIQLSYIGYLGTMGTDYYDYLIADPVMIPKASQKYYAEKIVYLPSFQVNDSTDLPPEITLTRKEVGLPEDGFVFCCFNNTYKFTPTIFDSWARILKQVENSVLIVYANNETSKANLSKEAEIRGVNSERLVFAGNLERPKYLARYRTADLFLDTHPYNAGTTASDALKMGLPIVTMMGQSFNSREAASILTSINLPELITNSLEEYEALAIELATHPEKMQAIKDKLASNLTTAPLYNTKLFVKNLESAYTTMYERHHEGLEPDHIYVE